MALPRINEQVKYSLIVPSTKEKITYRPFLVKEQKVLLIALEAGNNENVLRAIIDTVNACVTEDIDFNNYPTYDIEYIFTKIRTRSVGETSNINIMCKECETYNEVEIKLDDIDIKLDETSKKIKLNDEYTLELRHPSYDNILSLNNDEDNLSNIIYNMSIACMDKLYTEEEVLNFDDETQEELVAFLDGLTTKQFEEVMKFVSNIPSVQKECSFTCKECSTENNHVLKGIKDFF